MIRIDRQDIDRAVDAMVQCAEHAMDVGGRRIMFPLSRDQAEAALCGALSVVAPHGGPVTPNDILYFSKDGLVTFP